MLTIKHIDEVLGLANRIGLELYPEPEGALVEVEAAARKDLRLKTMREMIPGLLVAGALLELSSEVHL